MKKIIGFIGCGVMGEAILRGCKKDKDFEFVAIDKVKTTEALFCRNHKAKSANSIKDIVKLADVILIAVKPQDIDNVLLEIKKALPDLKKMPLVISIAAGITTKYIEHCIGFKLKVVRAMPNMAAILGESVTALKKGRFANVKDLAIAKDIFEKVGLVIEVKKDEDIDIVTALSGSGPAYLFYIVAAFMAAAEYMKFDKKKTDELIFKTLIGSAELLKENKFNTKKLVAKVASKGGTTEAALKVFKKKKLNKIISDGILAAFKRATELSR